jgi:hypothetical protein
MVLCNKAYDITPYNLLNVSLVRSYLNGREIPKKNPPEETVVLHILDVVDQASVLVLILGSHVTKYT